jgi:replicative DNA helicase
MSVQQLDDSIYESEIALISSLINYPLYLNDCDDLLPEYFATESLQKIYLEIQKQSGKGYDPITIYQALSNDLTLEEINEISLADTGFFKKSFSRHIKILKDAYKSKKLFKASAVIGELAFEKAPINERIDKAMAQISELEEKSDSEEWVDAYTASVAHSDLIEQRASGLLGGIKTGIYDLDEMLDGGLQKGNLFVIGARPSMGKTALGITLGLNIAELHSVGFLSMEMTHSEIRDRQAAILGSVALTHIKRPKKDMAWDKIVSGIEKSRDLRFYVSDKGGLNILQVRSRARSLKRSKGLDVLIVDYIGLMAGLDSKVSRAYQIEEISKGLKNLAKELDIVVICLAQLNRGAAEKNEVPGAHELRDSGSIEQDADIIGLIHRPIAANPNAGEQFQNYGCLRIAKNRQGKQGDIHLHYAGELTKFTSWGGDVPTKTSSNNSRGL